MSVFLALFQGPGYIAREWCYWTDLGSVIFCHIFLIFKFFLDFLIRVQSSKPLNTKMLIIPKFMHGMYVCKLYFFRTNQPQKMCQPYMYVWKTVWRVLKGCEDGLRRPWAADFFIKAANRKKDFHKTVLSRIRQ